MIARLVARIRAWWHRPADLTLTFPGGMQMAVVEITYTDRRLACGTYRLTVGDETYEVRAWPWSTNASIARRLGRALRRSGHAVS